MLRAPTAAASTITPLSSGLPKTGNRRPTVVIARGVPGNNVTTGSATDSLTGRCAPHPSMHPVSGCWLLLRRPERWQEGPDGWFTTHVSVRVDIDDAIARVFADATADPLNADRNGS